MTLKIGTILIAKEDRNFPNGSSITKGKEYKIEDNLDGHYYIKTDNITSVFRRNRIDDYFTIKRYTLTDLKEKKIAVKLRNYAEYKRLCEAVGDKNSGVDTYGATDDYFGNDNFNGNSIVFLTRKELEGRTLVPSIDLIDLEEKEETKEVINEAFYIQKLESEIARLKGENEELKEDNKIKSQLIREVKYKYIAMTESYENRLMVLQNTNTTLREECDELHNQLELREPQSTPDHSKRERMAWELMLRSVQVENSKHYSLSAEYCLNEVDTFLAKSKEVKP